MIRTALTVNTFVNPDGSPVANGYLLISLNVNGSVGNTQIQSNNVKVNLNASGVITGSPTFWPNASISPPGTFYIISVFSATGQLVAGPNKLLV